LDDVVRSSWKILKTEQFDPWTFAVEMQHVETAVKSMIFGLLANRPNPVMHTTG